MSGEDVTQIRIGKYRIGIIGFKETITGAVAELNGKPDDEIASELLRRLSRRNYITGSSVEEYRKAFLREFKKAGGLPADETHSKILEIKVLGTGCSRCNQLEQDLMFVASDMGLPADIEHVTDLSEISDYGVTGAPALVINGEVKWVGSTPSKARLKALLSEAAGKVVR